MAEKKKSILLQSGTNELELLVFKVGGESYGINVAKVKEIVQVEEVRPMPMAHHYVKGTFILREKVHLLVDLGKALEKREQERKPPYLVMVVEINAKIFGLLVDQVDSIQRMSWTEISSVPEALTCHSAPLTGMTNIGDEVIQILDLERIITEVTGEAIEGIREAARARKEDDIQKRDARILVVEDSSMIRKAICSALESAGYTNLVEAETGAQAWNILQEAREGKRDPFQAIITDVEMPEMDGLHLTSRIKGDSYFHEIPVIIYSSIVSKDNKKKCESVGADSQVTKFNTPMLLDALEQQLSKKDA